MIAWRQSGRPIKRDHTRSAEAEVVLQADASAMHLSLLGAAAQLVRQFEALREAGGAERVALRQQAAGLVTTLPP